MRFLKVEGAGNDFVLVDGFVERLTEPAALARAMSDRNLGVGADGLLLVEPAGEGTAARLRIWNSDGSEARMCGNGLRCVVDWLLIEGRAQGPEVQVLTPSGPRVGRRRADGLVEISMGVPDFHPRALPVLLAGDGTEPAGLPLPRSVTDDPAVRADPDVALCVSVGNPHLVVRVADPAAVDIARHGSTLQADPRLPEGANVHFVAPAGARVVARPWERGAGATRACGTGAVAVAAVALRLGWSPPGSVRVAMPGGELQVRFDARGEAWLAGPVRRVFRGEWGAS